MPTLTDPVAVSFGPFDVRWYAIFILLGIAGALILSSWLARRRGLDPNVLLDMAPWVVILGVAGARAYFVLLEWDRFRNDMGAAINIRSGGLSIHGGLVVGLIVIVVLCRIWRQPVMTWLDLIVPGLALGQAFGRWGNWANQEAFGKPTDLPWSVTIDPSRRPAGYEGFSTFHPTFLYESIFNLLNAVALSWLVLRGPRLAWFRNGDVTAAYLIAYGIARFIIERMRTDSLYIGPLPAAYWFSMALAGGGIILIILNRTVLAQDQPARTGA
ncbi:MAG TPA: prolipoprotein diacylglyceryl transferase, partial [Thermomicrobiales bacterium]|nr:prolipoprotein diacylglyceryl transferase [Thermomicrobiales bacterium]